MIKVLESNGDGGGRGGERVMVKASSSDGGAD